MDSAAKGENIVEAFDNSEFEKYKAEAKARWGNTGAYKEHAEKNKGLMFLMSGLGKTLTATAKEQPNSSTTQ